MLDKHITCSRSMVPVQFDMESAQHLGLSAGRMPACLPSPHGSADRFDAKTDRSKSIQDRLEASRRSTAHQPGNPSARGNQSGRTEHEIIGGQGAAVPVSFNATIKPARRRATGDVMATIDDGRRSVGAASGGRRDVGRVESGFGGADGCTRRQELSVVGSRPQIGHVAAQHRLPRADLRIDDAQQSDDARAIRWLQRPEDLQRRSDGPDLPPGAPPQECRPGRNHPRPRPSLTISAPRM